MKQIRSACSVILLISLVFFGGLVLVFPKIASALPTFCSSNDDCYEQTSNYCCGDAVCNDAWSGHCTGSTCGGYIKDEKQHQDSCPCGCSNGSCNDCTPPPPPPPPPPVDACNPPGSACGTCNTQYCPDGNPCAAGHTYCVYNSNGNYCGSCVEEVNNCPVQCAGPTVTPTPGPTSGPTPGPGCNNDPLTVSPNPANVGNAMTFQYSSNQAINVSNTWTGGTNGGVTGCNTHLEQYNVTCTAQSAVSGATWTHYWNNMSCSKTAGYTIIGPTPSPTLHPPTAYFDMNTKPDKGNIGQRLDYFAWAQDLGIDLIKVGIYVAHHGQQDWNKIGWAPSIECPTPNNNPLLSFYCSATYFPQQTGLFDVVVNAYDAAGHPCTGNPICAPPTPDPVLCAGWAYCGAGSNVVLTVISTITPWIQAVGDVHSNGRINAPGGP